MAVEQLRLELELMAFGRLALERWELALELELERLEKEEPA